MAMVVSHNYSAQMVLGELRKNNNKLDKTSRQAASGVKIGGAGDGASEYAISEKMRVQIRGLEQDIANAQTGTNLIKTAEGGIQEIINNLRSLKEMALNAANDHNTDTNRAIIQKEVDARLDTINDIAAMTNYNGRVLLNGDYAFLEEDVTSDISSISGNDISSSTVRRGIVPNKLKKLTGAFTPLGDTRNDIGFTRLAGQSVRIPAHKSYKNQTSEMLNVKLDFSAAVKDGSPASCPSDFDQQGFYITCKGCPQYINIKFDANATTSTYIKNASTSWDLPREYIIGIKNVTSVADLPKAVFEGIKSAKGRTEEALLSCYVNADGTNNLSLLPDGTYWSSDHFVADYRKYSKDSADGKQIVIDGEHNLRIVDNGDGSYSLMREASWPNNMGINDSGIYEYDPPVIITTTDDSYGENTFMDTSLVIHTGTKANQNLRIFINSMDTGTLGIASLKVNPRDAAIASLELIDNAIEYSLNENTRMGAYQSRLAFTIDNLVTASENTQASESVIRDADMAKAMMEHAKYSILSQSAQSMLAQANQNSSNVLNLLQ